MSCKSNYKESELEEVEIDISNFCKDNKVYQEEDCREFLCKLACKLSKTVGSDIEVSFFLNMEKFLEKLYPQAEKFDWHDSETVGSALDISNSIASMIKGFYAQNGFLPQQYGKCRRDLIKILNKLGNG